MTAEVVDLPAVVAPKQEITFKVRVGNRSGDVVSIPSSRAVMLTTSLNFIPGREPGVMVSALMKPGRLMSGDYGLNRNILNECPPQSDSLEPGSVRTYVFRWIPEEDDRGPGSFRVALPIGFPEIPLQPMEIRRIDEQGIDGNSH